MNLFEWTQYLQVLIKILLKIQISLSRGKEWSCSWNEQPIAQKAILLPV